MRGERSSSKSCVLRVLPYCQVSWLNFAQSQTICLLIYICDPCHSMKVFPHAPITLTRLNLLFKRNHACAMVDKT